MSIVDHVEIADAMLSLCQTMKLSEQKQLVNTYIKTALHRWATSGFDEARGTFVEALDFETNPLQGVNRRGRVQARQVYVYTLAHLWGFDLSGDYLALAKRAWARAAPIYLTKDGGWIFSATPDGKPVNT
jgi:mannose/cellobiose epimerase-like protein (N-acyl-D-glucosamine 2-epimerase family)